MDIKQRLAFLLITIMLIFTAYIMYDNNWKLNHCNQIYNNVIIPSPADVNKFCANKGYENGWLSQTCEGGTVQCHKSVGELEKYTCVKWE
jgi:hypothetical protein